MNLPDESVLEPYIHKGLGRAAGLAECSIAPGREHEGAILQIDKLSEAVIPCEAPLVIAACFVLLVGSHCYACKGTER